jgi:NitT/TauT family transport system permease protein
MTEALKMLDPEVELEVGARALEHARRGQLRRRAIIWGGRLILLFAVLILWEACSRWFGLEQTASRPSAVFAVLGDAETRQALASAFVVTVGEAALGFLLGAAGGVIAAIVLFFFQKLYGIIEPLLLALFAIPKIALAPLLIMWFGLGTTPKVLIAGILVFFLVLFNTYAGFAGAPKRLLAGARLLGANRWQIFRKVLLPVVAQALFVSLRLALPTAVTGALLGEFISANAGIGYLISNAAAMNQVAEVFAALFLLLFFVLVLNALIRRAEKLLILRRGAIS